MPIYEYEPVDHECLMCPGRVDAIQSVDDPPLEFCPDCGLPIRRVISSATFKLASGGAEAAGKRGFTTWKRAQYGTWEKVSGPGVDAIVGAPEDVREIAQEKKARVVDLDVSS